jgi:hypothetical protein
MEVKMLGVLLRHAIQNSKGHSNITRTPFKMLMKHLVFHSCMVDISFVYALQVGGEGGSACRFVF